MFHALRRLWHKLHPPTKPCGGYTPVRAQPKITWKIRFPIGEEPPDWPFHLTLAADKKGLDRTTTHPITLCPGDSLDIDSPFNELPRGGGDPHWQRVTFPSSLTVRAGDALVVEAVLDLGTLKVEIKRVILKVPFAVVVEA